MARGNFGERLKRERELREVTLEEITSATRIGPRFLEALENEDWEKLPGGVFNRGFVRSIARYLGLDEEVLLGEYDLAHPPAIPSPQEHPQQKMAAPRNWVPLAVVTVGALLLLAGIIAGGIYAWKRFVRRPSVQQTSAATVPALAQPAAQIEPVVSGRVASPPDAGVKPNAQQLDLLVSASAATHLLVLADGHVAFYDEVHAGENHRFTAQVGFEVTASDSGAVLLELNSQAMPPLGVPGSSGTIKLSQEDLRQASRGNSQR